jgi:hypothetical protein
MGSFPEPLEKIFQRVEEESERRAEQEAISKMLESSENGGSGSTLKTKESRRGSISISRLGQLPESWTEKASNGPSTPKRLSTTVSNLAFYQAEVKNGSVKSIASGRSAHLDEEAHKEEDHHVTQVHQIAGRHTISKAMGNLLPRRLSRARSASVNANGDANVVIGVSVEEATVESQLDIEGSRVIVHAPGNLRSQASQGSMVCSTSGTSGWKSKAKVLSQKLRPKSKSVSARRPPPP